MSDQPADNDFEQQEMEEQHDRQGEEADKGRPQSGGLDSPMTEEGAGRD